MSPTQIMLPNDKITEFCRRNRVKSLAVFGSVLRADFRSDSDIDVLVEFERDAKVGFLAMGRMQRELTELFQRQVDLVQRDGLKPVIREAVLASAEWLVTATADVPTLAQKVATILAEEYPPMETQLL